MESNKLKVGSGGLPRSHKKRRPVNANISQDDAVLNFETNDAIFIDKKSSSDIENENKLNSEQSKKKIFKHGNLATTSKNFNTKLSQMFNKHFNYDMYCCFGQLKVTGSDKTEKNKLNFFKKDGLFLFYRQNQHEEDEEFDITFFFIYKISSYRDAITKKLNEIIISNHPEVNVRSTNVYAGKLNSYSRWKNFPKQAFAEAIMIINSLKTKIPENQFETDSERKMVKEFFEATQTTINQLKLDKDKEKALSAINSAHDLSKIMPINARDFSNNLSLYCSFEPSRRSINRITVNTNNLLEKFSKSTNHSVKVDKAIFKNKNKNFDCIIFQSKQTNTHQFEHIFIDTSWISQSKIMLTFVIGISDLITTVDIPDEQRRKYLILFVFRTIVNEKLDENVTESSELYTQMIQIIKRTYPNIKSMSCDFSKSFIKAATDCNLKTIGCYFHFKKALLIELKKKIYRQVSGDFFKIAKLHPFKPNRISETLCQIFHEPDLTFAKYIVKTYPIEIFQFEEVFPNPDFFDFFTWTNNAAERQFGNFKLLMKGSTKRMDELTHLITNFIQKQNSLIKNKKDWVGGDFQTKSGSQRLYQCSDDIEKMIIEYKLATNNGEFEPVNEQLGNIKIINNVDKIKIEYHYSEDSSSGESYGEHDLQNSDMTPNEEGIREFYSNISKRISLMPNRLFKSLLEKNKRIKRSIPELLDKHGMTMAANLIETERERAYLECIDLRERVLLQEEQLFFEKREAEMTKYKAKAEFEVERKAKEEAERAKREAEITKYETKAELEAERKAKEEAEQARLKAEAKVKEQMLEIESLKRQLAQASLKE